MWYNIYRRRNPEDCVSAFINLKSENKVVYILDMKSVIIVGDYIMIQTYFGNGKGKTTAAVGASVRCAGCGNKVLFVQFLKNNDSGEFKILEEIEGIDILCSGECYNLYDNFNKECELKLTKAYNKLLFEDVKSKGESYQMIILDEILDAVEYGYINEEDLLELLVELKEHLEVILTGHKLTERIANVSDYISEIKGINHPYTKGVLARKGIEY